MQTRNLHLYWVYNSYECLFYVLCCTRIFKKSVFCISAISACLYPLPELLWLNFIKSFLLTSRPYKNSVNVVILIYSLHYATSDKIYIDMQSRHHCIHGNLLFFYCLNTALKMCLRGFKVRKTWSDLSWFNIKILFYLIHFLNEAILVAKLFMEKKQSFVNKRVNLPT